MTLSQDLTHSDMRLKNLPGKGKCKDLRRRTFLVVQWFIIRLTIQGKIASFPGRRYDSNGLYDKFYDFGVRRDTVTFCSYWSPRVLGPVHHKLLRSCATPNILCATRKDLACHKERSRVKQQRSREKQQRSREKQQRTWVIQRRPEATKEMGKKRKRKTSSKCKT